MHVVVPYTSKHPVVEQVLASYQSNQIVVQWADVSSDEDAYRRLLRSLWVQAQTVVIVEHDILPWPGAIEEIWHCMGEWCSLSYRLFGGYGVFHGFGCTKLSAALMQATPHVWDESKHWSQLDAHLYHTAREVGQEPHPHRPPVIHLNSRDVGSGMAL